MRLVLAVFAIVFTKSIQAANVCEVSVTDDGPCSDNTTRYHFNQTSEKCEHFLYGGCQGNANNFETIDECERTCLATKGEFTNTTTERHTPTVSTNGATEAPQSEQDLSEPILIGILVSFMLIIFIGVPLAIYKYLKKEKKIKKKEQENEQEDIMMELMHTKPETENTV